MSNTIVCPDTKTRDCYCYSLIDTGKKSHVYNELSIYMASYVHYILLHHALGHISNIKQQLFTFLSCYSDNTHCFETANFSKSRSTSSSLAKCPIRDEKNESDTWLAKISTYDCIFCKISKSNMYSRI